MKTILLILTTVICANTIHAQKKILKQYDQQFYVNTMLGATLFPGINASVQFINKNEFTDQDKYLSAGVGLDIDNIYYTSIKTNLTSPVVNSDNELISASVSASFMWKGRNINRKRSRSLQLQIGPTFTKKDTARFVLNGYQDNCTEIVSVNKNLSWHASLILQKHIPIYNKYVVNFGIGLSGYSLNKTSVFYRNNNAPLFFTNTDGDFLSFLSIGLQL